MNEYREKFEGLKEKSTFRGEQWFGNRQTLVEKYSWAVPNRDAIVYLSEFDKIVEVAAGNGYWANEIDSAGGTVISYDIDPPSPDDGSYTWAQVEQCSVENMPDDLFQENPILMVWPPYKGGVAAHVASRRPPHILYVGEPRGGCTGSNEFFDSIENEYGLVAKINIPSYKGVNDDLFHYIRKT